MIDEYGTLLNDSDRGKLKCLEKSCHRATLSKMNPTMDCSRFEPRSPQHPEGNQMVCLSHYVCVCVCVRYKICICHAKHTVIYIVLLPALSVQPEMSHNIIGLLNCNSISQVWVLTLYHL
jgi:hypothetical protein